MKDKENWYTLLSTKDKEHWSIEYWKKLCIGTFDKKPKKPEFSDRAIGISKQLPVTPGYVQRVIDEYPNLTDQQIIDYVVGRYELGKL